MVELVDTPDLGSGAVMRVSSSLIRRTFFMKEFRVELLPRFKEAPFTYFKGLLRQLYSLPQGWNIDFGKTKACPPEDRGESSRYFRFGPPEDQYRGYPDTWYLANMLTDHFQWLGNGPLW